MKGTGSIRTATRCFSPDPRALALGLALLGAACVKPLVSSEFEADPRAAGGRIWAVGTTSVRTLESVVRDDGTFAPTSGTTRIFIRPPYDFRAVDRLITNFHLPRSTLIMLVAAFAGYELTMRAYQEAIDEGYRFYSYGDAMAVV